jgi:hypothetical protein
MPTHRWRSDREGVMDLGRGARRLAKHLHDPPSSGIRQRRQPLIEIISGLDSYRHR